MAKVKKPIVGIQKHRTTGDFLVVHYAVQPSVGWSIGWGEPERFSPQEFRRRGLAVVLKSLREFFSRDGEDKSKVFRIPDPAQQLRFTRSHLSLGVRLQSPTRLVLTPTHRERGGYVGHREDEIELPLPCKPTKFFEVVEAAIDQCS